MIEQVDIESFKCFQSLHLPEMSQITVIGGKNNVGKTALLEALFVSHDRRSAEMLVKHIGGRGVAAVPADPDSMWAPFFHGFDLTKTIRIALTLNGKAFSTELAFDPTYQPPVQEPLAHGPRGGSPMLATFSGREVVSAVQITHSWPDSPPSVGHLYTVDGKAMVYYESYPMSLPAVILRWRVDEKPGEEAARLSKAIDAKRLRLVLQFLSVIAPVSDLSVSNAFPVPTVVCDIGLPRLVPVSYAGEGLARLLRIVLAMVQAEGGLVLVDEIENGIHYSVQEDFWKALAEAAKAFNCQVIATTHSYEMLRAAHRGLRSLFEADFRFVRLERNGAETKALIFTCELLGEALESGWEVR